MNFVIAFDVSMGKSNLVVYDHNHQCHFEGELEHTQAGFRALKQRINAIQEQAGHLPAIVFEATGVYSSPLERFLKSNDYPYSRLNPLEAKLQTAAMRRQKTDIGDAHELAKSHFRVVRQETFQQADYYDQLRGLGRYCEDIEKEISQHNNRLHAFLQMSFPLVEKVFAGVPLFS
nr:IS110 family transposase [Planococcus salinarum]